MTIVKGDSGVRVTYLQYALYILQYSLGDVDGDFGDITEEGVKKYQAANELTVTGHINGGTWLRLVEDVKDVQTALKVQGVYSGAIDGLAGPDTYNAVISFQQSKGLLADGIVGHNTKIYLYGYAEEAVDADFPLGENDRGTNVKYLQYGLHMLWCHPGVLDGVFGPATYNAVVEFQTKYGLTADGIVGVATWTKIRDLILIVQTALANKNFYKGDLDGKPNPSVYGALIDFQISVNLNPDAQIGPLTCQALLGRTSITQDDDQLPLTTGSSGKNVLYLQYALHILCIDPNGFDGNFGPGTEEAVREYQMNAGFVTTGVVDVETWDSICIEIQIIQQALANRGYDTGGVDGIAGDGTYSAVLAFQEDNGLEADGMVGAYTRQILNANGEVGTTSRVLSAGSKGSLTRYLQRMLDVLGYAVTINGYFDEPTKNAILSFQNSYGLEADGVVGPGTWTKLFEIYRVPVEGTGVEKFINVAKHEAVWAFQEDYYNNINPYGEWYGYNGAPWCAMFVSWCAYQAGILDTVVPKFKYCPTGVNEYYAKNKYYVRNSDYIPCVGDTVFFIDEDDTTSSHTGIIVEVDDLHIKAIEGNKGEKVKYQSYSRDDSYILGYGSNGGLPEMIPEAPSEEEKNAAIARSILRVLSAMGIDCSVVGSVLYITGYLGHKVELPIEMTLHEASVMLAANIELHVEAQRGTTLYLDHKDNENAIEYKLIMGEVEDYDNALHEAIENVCEEADVEFSSFWDHLDSVCLSVEEGNGVFEVEVGANYIDYTFTLEAEEQLSVYHSESYSFSFGCKIYVSNDEPESSTVPVITSDAYNSYVQKRREYEQRKNGGFEIIDWEIREVILGVSLVSVLLLLFKLFFASLTGIVFV